MATKKLTGRTNPNGDPIYTAGREGILDAGADPDAIGKLGSAGLLHGVYETGTNPESKVRWEDTNTSYSGCDITAVINLNGRLLLIGNLSTLSYSIHREKQPVRTLGRIYPKTYTRGSLTIAGSLIFTVFDQHVLSELRDVFDYEHNIADLQKSLLPNQFPPFDIVITYGNEYGHSSVLKIYGVEIVDEGQTHSINDMISENMMQYVAKDIDLMIKDGDRITHQDLTFNQALFTTDRNFNDPNKFTDGDRAKIRNEYNEYKVYVAKLEDEVNKWKQFEAIGTTEYRYLNLYRIGGIRSLSEAELYLRENQLKLDELEKFAEAYSTTPYNQLTNREYPNDYSIRKNS